MLNPAAIPEVEIHTLSQQSISTRCTLELVLPIGPVDYGLSTLLPSKVGIRHVFTDHS